MKTIVIANPKGGCGKTTVALSLGAALSQVQRVCLAERDQQGSLTKWHKRRMKSLPNSILHRAGMNPSRANLAHLAPNYDTMIVDTRPGFDLDHVDVIQVADFVLVPCRTSIADVEASMPLVEALKSRRIPFAFVINAAVPRASCTAETVALLSQFGQVLPSFLNQSTAHMDCLNTGKAALEMKRTSASGKATHALTLHVMELLNVR